MPAVQTWDCFTLGTHADGNSSIAVLGNENQYLDLGHEMFPQMIRGTKAGEADHLL